MLWFQFIGLDEFSLDDENTDEKIWNQNCGRMVSVKKLGIWLLNLTKSYPTNSNSNVSLFRDVNVDLLKVMES